MFATFSIGRGLRQKAHVGMSQALSSLLVAGLLASCGEEKSTASPQFMASNQAEVVTADAVYVRWIDRKIIFEDGTSFNDLDTTKIFDHLDTNYSSVGERLLIEYQSEPGDFSLFDLSVSLRNSGIEEIQTVKVQLPISNQNPAQEGEQKVISLVASSDGIIAFEGRSFSPREASALVNAVASSGYSSAVIVVPAPDEIGSWTMLLSELAVSGVESRIIVKS